MSGLFIEYCLLVLNLKQIMLNQSLLPSKAKKNECSFHNISFISCFKSKIKFYRVSLSGSKVTVNTTNHFYSSRQTK